MYEKLNLIYRGILILLILAFLAIFYQYSENGRYAYHREFSEQTTDEWVVDTRTGIIYGYSISDKPGKEQERRSYKIDLRSGKIWYNPLQGVDNIEKK